MPGKSGARTYETTFRFRFASLELFYPSACRNRGIGVEVFYRSSRRTRSKVARQCEMKQKKSFSHHSYAAAACTHACMCIAQADRVTETKKKGDVFVSFFFDPDRRRLQEFRLVSAPRPRQGADTSVDRENRQTRRELRKRCRAPASSRGFGIKPNHVTSRLPGCKP
jgi:hypothetical protein